jgi:asparagine synthase (glutamine-hydrolysing)
MCGIAGFISLNGRPADRARAAAMIATLRHRGPDDTGIAVDGPAALAAARLSIIDVAGGHQPIAVDGGITVAQNGEIYNYVELRAELERAGRVFRTSSDTEVIAQLYAEHGAGAFERMRGMFAVAIWDAPNQRLVLARDRVGKKPLYFARRDGEVLFGSETKAVLAALDQVPPVNAAALLSFFSFGYVAGDHSAFEGIERLPPGATLVVDVARRTVAASSFWRWPDARGVLERRHGFGRSARAHGPAFLAARQDVHYRLWRRCVRRGGGGARHRAAFRRGASRGDRLAGLRRGRRNARTSLR